MDGDLCSACQRECLLVLVLSGGGLGTVVGPNFGKRLWSPETETSSFQEAAEKTQCKARGGQLGVFIVILIAINPPFRPSSSPP